MCVYLLHFQRPISTHHTCQHYLGFALDLDARLAEHLSGRGARLTQVALERHIDFVVARISFTGAPGFRIWLPAERKEPLRQPLPASPATMREVAGDGQYGGFYALPDEDVLRVWAAGVEETREILASGWR